jgi:hypothetical protein
VPPPPTGPAWTGDSDAAAVGLAIDSVDDGRNRFFSGLCEWIATGSGSPVKGIEELLETALCHGWVDTQTKRIDDQGYAIRFVPATPARTGRPPTANRCGASSARVA